MVGNAGNGSGTEPTNIVNNTGVQMTTPGGSAEATVVGTPQGTAGSKNGFQYGYSVVQNNDSTGKVYAADKSGKDNNFRGITVFNNTLYVIKGSGSNGINTVYQVGTAGTLPTTGTAATTGISILPGFSTTLASATSTLATPFIILSVYGSQTPTHCMLPTKAMERHTHLPRRRTTAVSRSGSLMAAHGTLPISCRTA